MELSGVHSSMGNGGIEAFSEHFDDFGEEGTKDDIECDRPVHLFGTHVIIHTIFVHLCVCVCVCVLKLISHGLNMSPCTLP